MPSIDGNMYGLETLDLSNNCLLGQISLGIQLQTFTDPSIYMGNPSLCGVPLPTKCPRDDTFTATDAKHSNEDGSDKLWFHVSMVLGFVLGFWGICGTLLVKKSWRYVQTSITKALAFVTKTALMFARLKISATAIAEGIFYFENVFAQSNVNWCCSLPY
ncbi:unnamed protein product [Prunus brigantina]